MKVVEILLWIVGAVVTVSWAYGIRSYVRTGQGVTQQTLNQTMMFALALIIVPVFDLSPFQLLWMFPVGLVVGGLAFAGFPFSLLSAPGRVFRAICCIGLTES